MGAGVQEAHVVQFVEPALVTGKLCLFERWEALLHAEGKASRFRVHTAVVLDLLRTVGRGTVDPRPYSAQVRTGLRTVD